MFIELYYFICLHAYFLNLNCWISYERGANYFYYTSLNSSIKKIKCLKQVFK